MKIVFFIHSAVSDWNHGNAHFIRGLYRSLVRLGHEVLLCEPWREWSVEQLFHDHGHLPIAEFGRVFPDLRIEGYRQDRSLEERLDELTRGADLVVVHEFNQPEVVRTVGRLRRKRGDFALLFHDTHHRAVTSPAEMKRFDLRGYDGVLAYGASLADVYRKRRRQRAWVFHEAADTSVFYPRQAGPTDDVVWIGNWGDEERSAEIRAYLVESARHLRDLRFVLHGVRYPDVALRQIRRAGIDFRGWIPNHRVPEAFARARLTLHIPRGPYISQLPGIPTIRPFEALACGIPLLCTPWQDTEGLFRAGVDYQPVGSPTEMRDWIRRLVDDPEERERFASNGRETILKAHTCDHRAQQLEAICQEI